MKKISKWMRILVASVAIGAVCLAACAPESDTPGGELPEEHQVTLTLMDGDRVLDEVTGTTGDAIASLVLPTKVGYEFSGWLLNGQEYEPSSFPAEDMTLHASFTANPYTIVLDANGGTGASVTIDAVYDQAVNIPETGFTKSGYTLTGWAETADAEVAEYNVQDSLLNLTSVKDETVRLYAFYTPLPTEEGFVKENGTVLAYFGEEETVVLPDDCTAIASGAFSGNTTIREVVIPDTYTEIGFGAFEGCDQLEKLMVPFIGGGEEDNAFLAYIFGAATYSDNTFSYNMTDIGGASGGMVDEDSVSGTFYIPRSLHTVIINSDITEIPEGAFYYAYGLEKVIAYRYTDDEVPDENSVYTYRIRSVGDSAFEGCHKIGFDESINAEYIMDWLSGVETFGRAAFKGYVSANDYFTSDLMLLGELTSVRTIGDEAFMYNNMLCDVTFGEQLESIGENAFMSDNMLQRVIIPDSCKTIGAGAFDQCIYLTSVTIGSGVESIGDNAFAASAGLTEVFFEGALPASLARNAFYGLSLDGNIFTLLEDANEGLVFYFSNEEDRAAAEQTLRTYFPAAATDVAGQERGPIYYIGSTYDFTLTFSAGHTVIIDDPLYRTGFGIPLLVGTYERMDDAWYDAEIYTVTLLLSYEFSVNISYHLTATYTHYYAYRVDTCTMTQLTEERSSFRIGNINDEWYLEENEYGQIGLWHNGEFFDLIEDATYAAGGVSQVYADNSLRSLMYIQGNAYFEEVLSYNFVYIPDPDIEDELLTYYGTLYLDETNQQMVFGNYSSADQATEVYVDEHERDLEITIDGESVLSGKYETASEFGDEEYVVTVQTSSGEVVTVMFTDYLEDVVDGSNYRDIYARCRFTLDGEEHVLYNSKHSSMTYNYYVRSNGELSDDCYVLYQYEQYMEYYDEFGTLQYSFFLYPGFGEHTYTANNVSYHEYLTFETNSDETGLYYQFETDDGKSYRATVIDEFVGVFRARIQGTTGAEREYRPYYEDEHDMTFRNGDVSITLSGYGTAVYTDADGNQYEGSYNIASGTTVGQVFVTENSYYDLYEYEFQSDDGALTVYFVPNLFDAYDGSSHRGDMLLPDVTRNRTYRIYDRESGVCTGIFASSGYGMGVFYIMIYADGTWVTIDNYFFSPGATYAYYEQIGEQDGQPLYRMYNGLGKGFFTFVVTEEQSYGKNPDDMSNYLGYEMVIGEDYEDWWTRSAAVSVTGNISPSLDELEQMPSREEIGVYYTPNGYALTLDGLGHAELRDPQGNLVHTAEYYSYDAGVLDVTTYPFVYIVDGVTYEGTFDTSSFLLRLEINADGVLLNNFAKGEQSQNYTAAAGSEDVGIFSLYQGNFVGIYNVVDGKNVYNLGSYEADGDVYTFRFTDKKYVVTLNADGTYVVQNSYDAIRLHPGEYYATVYNPPMEGEPTVEFYGYIVRADESDPTKPLANMNSEYSDTYYIVVEDPTVASDQYMYGNTFYDADIIVYEDGELSITYIYLDIISITNEGWYYVEQNDAGEDTYFFVLDRYTAIILYTWTEPSVG